MHYDGVALQKGGSNREGYMCGGVVARRGGDIGGRFIDSGTKADLVAGK